MFNIKMACKIRSIVFEIFKLCLPVQFTEQFANSQKCKFVLALNKIKFPPTDN